ncbi:uncharacterized protein LOC123546061 [Mercenaria mercenaria]|uniref:uncharacterized protein LOC123546061 n=1 Tax=Mercenaria mercenaria TaxID=6596 RepID=UPI00234EC895|nr:uncharacterized protein LOC123546061 [Mercenaria mercenaria]
MNLLYGRKETGKKQELADEFFAKLRLSLAQSEAFVHLTNAEFMLDNSIIDPNLEKLKREIVTTATKQSYWDELYPARWAILERSLMEFKERRHTVLEKNVLEDANKNMPLPIETSEELELFLRFHHEAGFILYFSDGNLKDFILLQPQWLVDALKSLITARKFCAKDQELCIYWFEFSNTGILKRDLIDAVWSASSPFHERKDLILEFMEKLGIIARPRQCAGHRNDDVEFYVAPCVLKQTVPDSLIMFNCGGCRSTTKLCFTTPSRIIPVQMFNKLLAECITKWPISKQNGQYLMFCGCGVFDLTDMHEIYVYLRDNVIQIWINTYSEFTELDRDLCLNVRDYITESLCQSVRGSCEIETYVACPESFLKETQCMWKVEYLSEKKEIRCSGHGRRHAVRTSEILKYWVPNITDNDIFTAAFLKQTPKEKQLSRMAQKIGKEFRSLGFELGMTRAELDHIDMDEKNRTPVDKITAMLSHWLKKSACDATFDELYRAMIKTDIDPNNVLTGL